MVEDANVMIDTVRSYCHDANHTYLGSRRAETSDLDHLR